MSHLTEEQLWEHALVAHNAADPAFPRATDYQQHAEHLDCCVECSARLFGMIEEVEGIEGACREHLQEESSAGALALRIVPAAQAESSLRVANIAPVRHEAARRVAKPAKAARVWARSAMVVVLCVMLALGWAWAQTRRQGVLGSEGSTSPRADGSTPAGDQPHGVHPEVSHPTFAINTPPPVPIETPVDPESREAPSGEPQSSSPQPEVVALFPSGGSEVQAVDKRHLDAVAERIKKAGPEAVVLLIGHADRTPVKKASTGSNEKLSQKRAVSVMKALRQRGVMNRIEAVGAGVDRSLSSKEASRRVEMVLSGSEKKKDVGGAPRSPPRK